MCVRVRIFVIITIFSADNILFIVGQTHISSCFNIISDISHLVSDQIRYTTFGFCSKCEDSIIISRQILSIINANNFLN